MNFKIGYVTDPEVEILYILWDRLLLNEHLEVIAGKANSNYDNSNVIFYFKNRPHKDVLKGKKIWGIEL